MLRRLSRLKYAISQLNSGTDFFKFIQLLLNLNLSITGKPSKPKGPLDVADVTKNGCTLSWKKPEDDGGSPIDYYEIEKLDPVSGKSRICVLRKKNALLSY